MLRSGEESGIVTDAEILLELLSMCKEFCEPVLEGRGCHPEGPVHTTGPGMGKG